MLNPIFIIGVPRSGTTLLRLLLTTHTDICIPPESLFLSRLEPQYGNISNLLPKVEDFLNDLYNRENFPKFCEWNVDQKLLLHNLKNHQDINFSLAIETVYQTYRQQFDPKALIWGDKNPCHIHCLEKIRRHFPTSKIILIIRDFRACYSSMKNIAVYEQKAKVWTGPTTLEGMTHQWNKVTELIDEYYQKREQFYLLHYEDLVREPSVQLIKICEWLGVSFQESMLEFYKKNTEIGLVLPSQAVLNPNTFRPINNERIDAWQNELSFAELRTIELVYGKSLEKLGYNKYT